MRQLSDDEKAQAKKKLKASVRARAETKFKLIDAAHEAEDKNWPQCLWPDLTEDAWFERKTADARFVEKRGGFPGDLVMLALTDPDWETQAGLQGISA
jgi:hypothetical protein